MKKFFKNLLDENKWNIKSIVIKEALASGSPKTYLEDVLQHWCQSWIVSSLIYYKDTHKFFDKHYDEIEEIRNELQDEWIMPNDFPKGDLKNDFAWMSYEHRAYELYSELENEGF